MKQMAPNITTQQINTIIFHTKMKNHLHLLAFMSFQTCTSFFLLCFHYLNTCWYPLTSVVYYGSQWLFHTRKRLVWLNSVWSDVGFMSFQVKLHQYLRLKWVCKQCGSYINSTHNSLRRCIVTKHTRLSCFSLGFMHLHIFHVNSWAASVNIR